MENDFVGVVNKHQYRKANTIIFIRINLIDISD